MPGAAMIGALVLVVMLMPVFVGRIIAVRNSVKVKLLLDKVAQKPRSERHSAQVDGHIYYDDSRVVGSAYVTQEGLKIASRTARFEAVIPWELISVIRVVAPTAGEIANIRISGSDIMDRKLSVPWSKECDRLIPERISIIRDRV